uniref:Reverse transcriptase RNase H-like domain-containing protein n=1 Tax=Amphimedon queenslandica TaxID=400682 RepID=A0A1X7VJS8_AMPQE
VVPKKEGNIRICGDYKVTINSAIAVDIHPIFKPQELFASMAGREKFTKLDLSQAYQQLLLRETEEHLKNLEAVIRRLQKHGVTVKLSKCKFLCKSVKYLGDVIDKRGLHAAYEKVKALVDAPLPKNVKELRSFVGLINYYMQFIKNLARLLYPLNCLLRQNTTDASANGLGTVLSHVDESGNEKPVAFASMTLTPAERNHAQLEKGALSIIFEFQKYLYGRHFNLLTDHRPLVSILGPKTGVPTVAAARLQKWAIHLSAYSFLIGFRKTGDHGNANCLSRLPLSELGAVDASDVVSRFHEVQMSAVPPTHNQLKPSSRTDPVVSKVLTYTLYGWPQFIQDDLKPYWRRHELSLEEGCLLWENRVVIPAQCRDRLRNCMIVTQ